MDTGVLERLIDELMATRETLVVIDSAGAVAEMKATEVAGVEFKDGWAMLESADWHVHLDLSAVQSVQFVEADDNHHDLPKLYYVRFSDVKEDTLIRFYFPNPWLDDDENRTEFQSEKLRNFEAFRDRYVGEGCIVFVRRSHLSKIE